MPSIETVNHLVESIATGKILEAFEEFYAEDVVMQENANPATVGKSANREREMKFVSSVKEVFENKPGAVIVSGDHVALEWVMDFRNADGVRLKITQVAVQKWSGDQIVHEHFYYDSANLVVTE